MRTEPEGDLPTALIAGVLLSLVFWFLLIWGASCLISCVPAQARRVLTVERCLDGGRACWALVSPDPRAGPRSLRSLPGVPRMVLVSPEVQPGDCVCSGRSLWRRCRC